MKRELILVGYKIGATPPPNSEKIGCLTTEIAHRTNSYGLPHIIEYEENDCSDNDREDDRDP